MRCCISLFTEPIFNRGLDVFANISLVLASDTKIVVLDHWFNLWDSDATPLANLPKFLPWNTFHKPLHVLYEAVYRRTRAQKPARPRLVLASVCRPQMSRHGLYQLSALFCIRLLLLESEVERLQMS